MIPIWQEQNPYANFPKRWRTANRPTLYSDVDGDYIGEHNASSLKRSEGSLLVTKTIQKPDVFLLPNPWKNSSRDLSSLGQAHV